MKPKRKRFPYRSTTGNRLSPMPIVPCRLSLQSSIDTHALIDSGAALNVIPYSVGIRIGAEWSKQTMALVLAGNLENRESRAILLNVEIEPFPPVELAFAWASTDSVPVLFGQVNFFREFDVCLFGSQARFEIGLKK